MFIRKAIDTEYSIIKDQRLAAYTPYKEIIPEGHWMALKNTLAAENTKDSGAEVFVCEIAGTIAGSVVLFPSKSKAYEWDTEALEHPEIRMLAVNQDFQGKGVGKMLVEHCIQQAKEEGAAFIGLHTGSFMKDAIRLYEKLGFVRVPLLDFEPLDDGIVVKAFRLAINS